MVTHQSLYKKVFKYVLSIGRHRGGPVSFSHVALTVPPRVCSLHHQNDITAPFLSICDIYRNLLLRISLYGKCSVLYSPEIAAVGASVGGT